MRSGLTMLGIIIGVASVIVMIAIGQGAQSGVQDKINQLGTNLLTVSAGGRSASNVRAVSSAGLTDKELNGLQGYFGSRVQVAPESDSTKQLIVGSNNTSAQIRGVTSNIFSLQNFTLEYGRLLTDQDNTDGALDIVLGQVTAQTLFGDQSQALGQIVRVGNHTFTVVGTLQLDPTSDDQAFIPLRTMQLRFTGTGNYSTMLVLFAKSEDMTSAQDELTAVLAKIRNTDPTNPNFRVVNRSNFLSTLNSVTSIFTLLLGGVAGISLIVGGIGVMNIMLVSVTERTREIGIRKAIGAHQRDILLQFLIEATVLALMGGIIGVGFAFGTVYVLETTLALAMQVTTASVMMACAFSAATGILFGFLPARRASQLKIIDALRYE